MAELYKTSKKDLKLHFNSRYVGEMELWHEGNFITSYKFWSMEDRRKYYNRWRHIYDLDIKDNFGVIIRHFRLPDTKIYFNTETKECFFNLKQAAKSINMPAWDFRYQLRNYFKNTTNFIEL